MLPTPSTLSLLLLGGCFPLVRSESVPDLPDDPVTWSEAPEQVLVFPVWERQPFLNLEHRQQGWAYLDPPHLVKPQALRTVPERCVERSTTMIVVANGAALGRGGRFQGLLALSDRGELLWWPTWGGGDWSQQSHRAWLDDAWHAELARALASDGWVERSAGGPWGELPRARLRVELTDPDREEVQRFLALVPTREPAAEQERWQRVRE